MLLYKKDLIIVKDTHNSTEHINVYNLMYNEEETLLKIITIYGQPDKKKAIMNNLIRLLNRHLRLEAGTNTIVLGDFNVDFNAGTSYGSQLLEELQELGFHREDHNQHTYQRTGTQPSSLDHMFINFETAAKMEVVPMHTSDHDYVEMEMTVSKAPVYSEPKEFFYSNLLNNPKLQELEDYMEYLLKYLELVLTD